MNPQSITLHSIIISEDEFKKKDAQSVFFGHLKTLSQMCRKDETQVIGVLHSFLIPKMLSEAQLLKWNDSLALAYREFGFVVLGGDISSGNKFQVFITALAGSAEKM